MTFQTSSKVNDSCNQRIRGLGEHIAANDPILIEGKSMTLAQVIAVYQASLDTHDALVKKRNETKVALEAWQAAEASRTATDAALKNWVFAKFGPTSQEAKDIGFLPRKKAVATTKTKYQATLQSSATREARHTMSPKAKQKIKGTTVVPTEPAAPATTAPAGPAPANATNGVTPAH